MLMLSRPHRQTVRNSPPYRLDFEGNWDANTLKPLVLGPDEYRHSMPYPRRWPSDLLNTDSWDSSTVMLYRLLARVTANLTVADRVRATTFPVAGFPTPNAF